MDSPTVSIFRKIYLTNAWKDKESRSGRGSTVNFTKNIIQSLPLLLEQYNVMSVFDCPCGDFNWMKDVVHKIPRYLGGDIVPELVEANKKLYPNIEFIQFDLITQQLPDVDMLFCRDCLFHFCESDIEKTINNIKRSNIKYLLTTNFTIFKNRDISTGQWRPLSLRKEPYLFPEPLCTVTENYTGLYEDKHMALWKVEDLPS